jgi:hypothetical protein
MSKNFIINLVNDPSGIKIKASSIDLTSIGSHYVLRNDNEVVGYIKESEVVSIVRSDVFAEETQADEPKVEKLKPEPKADAKTKTVTNKTTSS